jgi:hypothetical protein
MCIRSLTALGTFAAPSSMWAVVSSQSASDTRHARSAPASLSHPFACHAPVYGSFSDAYGLKTLGTPALLARLNHSPCPVPTRSWRPSQQRLHF